MFGKIMSISDDLMWRYFELLSFEPISVINGWKTDVENGVNPRDIKFRLAEELVARFHDMGRAVAAKEEFIARFRKGAMPDDMPEVSVHSEEGSIRIAQLLREAELVGSSSEGMRMIKQGAVKIDGEKVEDNALEMPAGTTRIYQVGKRRFARVTIL
jgi:tyrosyl-tRNA synthetase